MSATIFRTATEYAANRLTFVRGGIEDVDSVWVYHSLDPGTVPAPGDFVQVTLVDGTQGDPLAEGNWVDVLSLIGPRGGDIHLPEPGTYQRWVMVRTGTEDIIRRPDTITVM